jgi:hypothetical protein
VGKSCLGFCLKLHIAHLFPQFWGLGIIPKQWPGPSMTQRPWGFYFSLLSHFPKTEWNKAKHRHWECDVKTLHYTPCYRMQSPTQQPMGPPEPSMTPAVCGFTDIKQDKQPSYFHSALKMILEPGMSWGGASAQLDLTPRKLSWGGIKSARHRPTHMYHPPYL